MRRIFLFSLLFVFACTAVRQSACPPPGAPIIDSVFATKLDTIVIPFQVDSAVQVPVALVHDSSRRTIRVSAPKSGDAWPLLQAASDYCNAHHIHFVPTPGVYNTTQPLILAALLSDSSDFAQYSCYIE